MKLDPLNHPIGLAHAFLFVPANRPERYQKALDTGAHIIIDLEDAVGHADKPQARLLVREHIKPLLVSYSSRIILRMNSLSTEESKEDLKLISELPILGLLHPKTETVEQLDILSQHVTENAVLIPMIETAQGIDQLSKIAAHPKVVRLTLGNIDLQADLGLECDAEESQIDPLRFQMTYLSRLNALAPPIDGVTVDLQSTQRLHADVLRAKRIGFLGKLCLHPKQVAEVLKIHQPTSDQIAKAQAILKAFEDSKGGAVQLDGKMIDRPVVLLAQRLINSIQKN